MTMFSAARFLTAILLLLSPFVCFAEEFSESETISYDVDARLTYLERVDEPVKAAIVGADSARPRDLGLTRFRLGIEWNAGNTSSLKVGFRPGIATSRDYESELSGSREFDSRAGDTYRAASTVNLLDDYQLVFHSGVNLDAEFGVFSAISRSHLAFDNMIEFGLNVHLPEKFSGVKLVSSFLYHEENLAKTPMPTGIITELLVFQGHNDRAEVLASDNDRADLTPHALDPYQGLALTTDWTPSPLMKISIIAGIIDEAATPSGKRNESFGEASLGWDLPIGSRWVKALIAFRYAAEKWRVDEEAISDLVQQSIAVSSAVQLSQRNRLLIAAQLGRSERHKNVESTSDGVTTVLVDRESINPLSGYQVELGFDAAIARGLIVNIGASHEERTQEDDSGEEIGAFENEVGYQKTLRRMIVALKYQLGGSR